MANVIVSLFTVAAMLSAVALMAQGSFRSIDVLSDAWKRMESRSGEIARTKIEVLNTSVTSGQVELTIRNSGQTSLLNFDSWDVLSEYYDSGDTYHQDWFSYTSTTPLADNQWTVIGIYVTATTTAEVFQPNVLDPTEEMIIKMKPQAAPKTGGTHKAIIGTPNGVTTSTGY